MYRTEHLVTGQFYIGRHQTTKLDDGYLGSGTWVRRVIREEGRSALRREVIGESLTALDLYHFEYHAIQQWMLDPRCMNLNVTLQPRPYSRLNGYVPRKITQKTEAEKERDRRARLRRWMYRDKERKSVYPAHFDVYLQEGWAFGQKPKEQLYVLPESYGPPSKRLWFTKLDEGGRRRSFPRHEYAQRVAEGWQLEV